MPADRVGQRLGYYNLLSVIGRGAFAEVYLGEHIHLKTTAAVKVLRAQLSRDEANSFTREAQLLAHLSNPHIVRVLDFGFDNDIAFLVMEYAPNGTLRKLHPRGTTAGLPMIVAYVKQAADALYYAHSNQVIHRDVKPENMLLGRNNELLLSDFGIATVAQSSQKSNYQAIAGTAIYMAPEQLSGKPQPASDQYALAVIVYEWLVGAPPFQGSFGEISSQHLTTSPASLRSRVPTVSLLVEEVVLTALNKAPAERFGNIRAFANALESAYLHSQQPARGAGVKPVSSPSRPLDNSGQPKRTAPQGPGSASGRLQQTGAMQMTTSSQPGKAFFNTLPALPEARVSEHWWPTFFVELEKRKEICDGKLPQKSLGITGRVPLATSPLIPLPISDAYIKPMAGSLSGLQKSQRRFAQAPQATAQTRPPVGTKSGGPAPKRSSRPGGAGTGAGAPAPSAGGATGQIRRSTSTSTPTSTGTGATPAQGSKGAAPSRAALYAAIALTLSLLTLCIIGITFIPQVGRGSIWTPWLNFPLAAFAFGYGVAGLNHHTSAGRTKGAAGFAIAFAVLAVLLEASWLAYAHSYLYLF